MSAEYIVLPADKAAIERGCYIDEAAGQRVVTFFERFLTLTQGTWQGEPFKLLPWQERYLRTLFAWKNADGTRRFRRTFLTCAKKNAKTTICAGIGLYLLIADGEAGAECYLAASDREQGSILYRAAAAMVRANLSNVTSQIAMIRELYAARRYEDAFTAAGDSLKWTTTTLATVAGMTNGVGYGFRRATSFPTDWTDYADAAYSYGVMQAGDIIGPWVFYDIQRYCHFLKWVRGLLNWSLHNNLDDHSHDGVLNLLIFCHV